LQLFQVFFQVFLQVFQTHILSVSSVFIHILQVLYLDVSKVDRVLYLPPRLGVSSASSAALHHSQTAEEARRGSGDGGTNASARSPLLCYVGRAGIALC
jgi:hypothetical protein